MLSDTMNAVLSERWGSCRGKGEARAPYPPQRGAAIGNVHTGLLPLRHNLALHQNAQTDMWKLAKQVNSEAAQSEKAATPHIRVERTSGTKLLSWALLPVLV